MSNTTGDTHPIHLHQVSFQLISRQKFNWKIDPVTDGVIVTRLTGKPTGPDANEAGWKDTVRMNPGEVTIIEARFDVPGKYVWHCHFLEHEEHDMMRGFEVVSPPPAAPQPAAMLSITPTGIRATGSAVDATASPISSTIAKGLDPGVRTGAPDFSVTDGMISLLNGQVGPLLSTDGEQAIDLLAADLFAFTRKKKRY